MTSLCYHPGETITDNNIIAVLFSGDGGWYSFEQSISGHLAEGDSVLGIDTKKYFWNRKTPEKQLPDITRLLTYYGKE
jgi:type IV secretory pathway VirJ component